MRNLNKYILLTVLISYSVLSAFAGSKQQAFEDVRSKLNGLETVHIVFGINNSDMVGEIYAQKGGKIRMSLRDNIIISDGKTIWNVSPGNSVAISDYEEDDGFSLETILFELVSNLTPKKYSQISKTNSDAKYSLELAPKANSVYEDQIENLIIQFDINREMKNIIVNQIDGSSVSYQIKEIKYNPKLSANKFTFVPTEGLEIIDFR